MFDKNMMLLFKLVFIFLALPVVLVLSFDGTIKWVFYIPTSIILAVILRTAYKRGLFTKPHLR